MDRKMDIVCSQIDRILEEYQNKSEGSNTPILVAIDGMCASGKSTLGNCLKEKYQCNLFHMDDFFLRPEQRTEERLEQAGGNINYERFEKEIIRHLSDREGLVYQRYNCGRKVLEEKTKVPYCLLNIIEGAYSQHPYFGDIYNLRFFLSISFEEQKQRILVRDGKEKLERFLAEWIPMENRYFEEYQIRSHSICL